MAAVLRACFAVMFLLPASALFAQTATLSVEGHVAHPLHLTMEELKAMPAATVGIRFQTDHGPESATYTGALLLDVLKEAGPVDQAADKGAKLQHTIIARGKDGYGVALAIGEIDPRFAGKQVVVAYARDGKMLAGQAFRLVVPGDAHGGRSVNDLVSLTVN